MLPDVMAATRTLLVSAGTSAGTQVGHDLNNPTGKYITFRRDGSGFRSSNQIDTARITLHCHAPTEPEAHTLALEVIDVMEPTTWSSGTFVGAVGDVFFTGGSRNAGPAELPEEFDVPGYLLSYILHYAQAA